MRRHAIVPALAIVLIPSLLVQRPAAAQAFKYEYVGKIVCGPQTDSISTAMVRGYYATSVNVRNPAADARAIVRKWVVWTYPTEKQAPETPVSPDSVRTLVLAPRNAFTSECRELEAATKTNPNTFHEGFFYVWSDRPLDVIGLYSAANLVGARVAGQVSTMHIDRFPQRVIGQ